MILGHEADPRQERCRVRAGPAIEHAHFARGRPDQPDRELQQRCLPCAVRSDERRHRAGGDLEVCSRGAPRSSRIACRAVRYGWRRSCDPRDGRRTERVGEQHRDRHRRRARPHERASSQRCNAERSSFRSSDGGGAAPARRTCPRRGALRSAPRGRAADKPCSTVFGLIVDVPTTSFTVGSWSPGRSIPSRIACRTCWTSCKYAGTPERSRWNWIMGSTFSRTLDKALSS